MHPDVTAYIDPNTGGMLFQILAVVFGAFSGIVLLFSGRIRQYIARLRRSKREKNETASSESQAEVGQEDDQNPPSG